MIGRRVERCVLEWSHSHPCPMSHVFRTALIASALFILWGCDSGGPTAECPDPNNPACSQPPAPSNTTVRLDFNYVEAVKDCDGFPLGEGEFDLRVTATPSFASGTTVLNSIQRGLDDGERTGALGRRTFTTEATSGKQINVKFEASEIDFDILGSPFDDSRMSNREITRTHTFNGTTWSGTGPRSITMGSGDCQVRLSYDVSVD